MSMTIQPDAAPPPAELTPSPTRSAKLMWAILGVVLVADLLDLLDATITNIAAPTAPPAVGGPALAGFIIAPTPAARSWRPVFLINIVLGGAGLIAAPRLLPRVAADPATRVDLTGSLLLGGAVFSLLYGLIQGS